MAKPKKELERHPEHLDFRTVDSVWDELNAMRDAIMRRAYAIFDGRGGGDGRDLDDWLAAEQELTWKPAIELVQEEGRLTLQATTPGFDPDELDVRVGPEDILIQSARTYQPSAGAETVFQCEFAKGKLFRDVHLPARIDPEQARAEYRNGLLRVTAPVVEDSGPQQIEISEA
jgi:HSP20 family protein